MRSPLRLHGVTEEALLLLQLGRWCRAHGAARRRLLRLLLTSCCGILSRSEGQQQVEEE